MSNKICLASSGGIAAHKCPLAVSPFGLKSLATSRLRTTGSWREPLLTFTYFVSTGGFPVLIKHSSSAASSNMPLSSMYLVSSLLAAAIILSTRMSPVLVSETLLASSPCHQHTHIDVTAHPRTFELGLGVAASLNKISTPSRCAHLRGRRSCRCGGRCCTVVWVTRHLLRLHLPRPVSHRSWLSRRTR